MRRAAKVDANQGQIVSGLRAIGCTVESLAAHGKNLPDLLVGFRNRNYLLEVKPGDAKDKRQRRLRPGQVLWHSLWQGQVAKIETLDEAIAIVTQ